MGPAKGCVHNFAKICLMLDMCKWVSILEEVNVEEVQSFPVEEDVKIFWMRHHSLLI